MKGMKASWFLQQPDDPRSLCKHNPLRAKWRSRCWQLWRPTRCSQPDLKVPFKRAILLLFSSSFSEVQAVEMFPKLFQKQLLSKSNISSFISCPASRSLRKWHESGRRGNGVTEKMTTVLSQPYITSLPWPWESGSTKQSQRTYSPSSPSPTSSAVHFQL